MTSAPVAISDNRTFEDWYKPGPKISEFHASFCEQRVLIGGRGSGKTTAIAVESIGHGWHNAGGKVYLLRKTEDANLGTTLETFEIVFASMGTAYEDTGYSLFKKYEQGKMFRIPSRKAVDLFNKFMQTKPKKQEITVWLNTVGNKYCSWILFAGVPSSQYRAQRFRGFECSMLVLVEADEFVPEDMDYAVACLRWKGADPETCNAQGYIKDTCLILDSNPPGTKHWIALKEAEAIKEKDTTIKFWHIPTAENEHNLPPDYVKKLKKQYRRNPAMMKRMVFGEYADAFDGKPVLWGFDLSLHARENLQFPVGAYLVRGWDFGTTQSVVWSAYFEYEKEEYWWDLFEYFATQSDVEIQCREALKITDTVFPFWNDRNICAGILDYCDPAGRQKKDTGRSISTLETNGIYPGFCYMPFQDSITVYNRLLEKRDKFGRPCYLIDEKTCPMLYTASCGGYRWPVEGEPGFQSGYPLKGEAGGNYDHVADAARYAKINCLKNVVKDMQEAKESVGKLAVKQSYNRKRRWI